MDLLGRRLGGSSEGEMIVMDMMDMMTMLNVVDMLDDHGGQAGHDDDSDSR